MSAAGHTTRNKGISAFPIVVASAADTPITENFRISSEDSMIMRVRVTAENTSAATLKLQSSPDNGHTWEDAVSVSLPDGDTTIRLTSFVNNSALPLWPLGRLVIASGDADITAISVSSRP